MNYMDSGTIKSSIKHKPLKSTRISSGESPIEDDAPLSTIARLITNASFPVGKRVLIYTMDSLTGYIENAKRGGPAGELRVRSSLQQGLEALGVPYAVAASDAEFDSLFRDGNFSHLFLDEWTVVDPSWRVRVAHPNVFAFAFFGAASHPSGLPPSRFLTAYPYPTLKNTFLGFVSSMPSAAAPGELPTPPPGGRPGGRLGVVWGKRRSYFDGREPLLAALAAEFPELDLVAALAEGEPAVPGVRDLGPLPPPAWRALLRAAAFLLGLGHPLAGPSALDALAAGAAYIDPTHPAPPEGFPHFPSQHPYLRAAVGPPRVCAADLADSAAVFACVRAALNASAARDAAPAAPAAAAGPFVPPEFRPATYLRRLRDVLEMPPMPLPASPGAK